MQKGDVVSIRSSYIYRGEKYAKTYIGGAFLVNRDLYEIISVNGDVAVIGVGEIPFAAVRPQILKEEKIDRAWASPCLSVGDTVHVLSERDYMGHFLPHGFADEEYTVLSITQDRVVIGDKNKSFAIRGEDLEVG